MSPEQDAQNGKATENAGNVGNVASKRNKTSKLPDRERLNVAAPGSVPGAVVRVNVSYATTALRVALMDKRTFDRMRRRFMKAVDEAVSQHEFFAIVMAHVEDDVPALISRWASRPSNAASERELAAAVEAFPPTTVEEED